MCACFFVESVLNKPTMNTLPADVNGNILKRLAIQDILNLRRTETAQDASVGADIERRLAEEHFPLLDRTTPDAIAALRDVVESRKNGWMPVAPGDGEFFLAVTRGGRLVRSYTSLDGTRETKPIRVNTNGTEVIFRNVYHSGGKEGLGNYMSVAVSEDGRVYAWNQPWVQGLVLANLVPSVEPMPTLARVATVAMGFRHCIAVCDTGRVYSWGNNEDGECGNGDTTGAYVSKPTEVRFRDDQSTVESNELGVGAAAGFNYSLVVALDGTLWAFGNGDRCQLGTGVVVRQPVAIFSPNVVPFYDYCNWNNRVVIKKVAAGDFHNLAIDERGWVFGWGWNASGQLGMAQIDREEFIVTPTRLCALNVPIVSVAAGARNSFAVTETGALYTWGVVNDFYVADEHTVRYMTDLPERVRYFQDRVVAAVSLAKFIGQGYTMVVTADGAVYGCPGGAVQTVTVADEGMETDYVNWRIYGDIVCERKDVLLGA